MRATVAVRVVSTCLGSGGRVYQRPLGAESAVACDIGGKHDAGCIHSVSGYHTGCIHDVSGYRTRRVSGLVAHRVSVASTDGGYQ